MTLKNPVFYPVKCDHLKSGRVQIVITYTCGRERNVCHLKSGDNNRTFALEKGRVSVWLETQLRDVHETKRNKGLRTARTDWWLFSRDVLRFLLVYCVRYTLWKNNFVLSAIDNIQIIPHTSSFPLNYKYNRSWILKVCSCKTWTPIFCEKGPRDYGRTDPTHMRVEFKTLRIQYETHNVIRDKSVSLR